MLHLKKQEKTSYFKKVGGMLAALGTILASLFLCVSLAWGSEVKRDAPDGLIKTLTECVVTALREDPTIQPNNTQGLIRLINKEILPYTNIEKTTRLAIGRHWKKADAEQKKELIEEFKTLLIYTYAGALANNRQANIEVLASTTPNNADDTVIKTQVIHQGQPIEVAYRLSKEQELWSVYDISVAGVWLVQNFRQQFNDTLSRPDGIDALIQSLKQQNKRLTGR